MQNIDDLRVSVFMITFNHSEFIKQAIEGVLAQKTTFAFKLFIGDDYSTDGTQQICLDYQRQFPDKIELILNEKNIGAHANAFNIHRACFLYGKYTAMCEGDDYWTNPLKLQKQIDFLEANSDFAICFHNVVVVYEDGISQSHLLHDGKQKEITTFEDLAKENFIPTPSCVFRHNLIKDFPAWMSQMALGDWILHLLNAQHGKIKYFHEAMGVYRVHDKGAWSNTAVEKRMLDLAIVIEHCRIHFYPRGAREFLESLNETYKNLCVAQFAMFEKGDYKEFRHYYYETVKAKSYISTRMLSTLTIRYILSYIPFLRDYYKTSKKANR